MATYGVDWTAEQNSIVVEAYFDMLLQQQDGTRYVKAEYNRNVQSRTGKTRGSVEWKFQNISFLLQEMGHPTITGYKPRSNAQRGTLYDAISRHLQANQYPPLFTALENDANLRGAFNPESLEDARTETYGRIVLRRGQPAFRRELLEAYGGKCAVPDTTRNLPLRPVISFPTGAQTRTMSLMAFYCGLISTPCSTLGRLG